jgi:hypothetical protein
MRLRELVCGVGSWIGTPEGCSAIANVLEPSGSIKLLHLSAHNIPRIICNLKIVA